MDTAPSRKRTILFPTKTNEKHTRLDFQAFRTSESTRRSTTSLHPRTSVTSARSFTQSPAVSSARATPASPTKGKGKGKQPNVNDPHASDSLYNSTINARPQTPVALQAVPSASASSSSRVHAFPTNPWNSPTISPTKQSTASPTKPTVLKPRKSTHHSTTRPLPKPASRLRMVQTTPNGPRIPVLLPRDDIIPLMDFSAMSNGRRPTLKRPRVSGDGAGTPNPGDHMAKRAKVVTPQLPMQAKPNANLPPILDFSRLKRRKSESRPRTSLSTAPRQSAADDTSWSKNKGKGRAEPIRSPLPPTNRLPANQPSTSKVVASVMPESSPPRDKPSHWTYMDSAAVLRRVMEVRSKEGYT